VRWILGFPAGLGPDVLARLLGARLQERLGQPFVIENRPGAGSNIGTEAGLRAPPDGYTLLFPTVSNAFNATLYDDLKFDIVNDIAPVAGLTRTAYVVAVNPALPVTTVPEFIAYAKANPGKINMGSNGIGSTPHIYGELFKVMTGVDMVHVPYRASYLPDLISGQLQIAFPPISTTGEFIKSGKLRALAVTTATRSGLFPDLPTVSEFVPGYEASAWQGVAAPKNTPAEIVATLSKEFIEALAAPAIKERLAALGAVAMPMNPVEFGRFIADETEKWAKVIRAANIKAK
jgi:tripartite-type tricarboxylate transporter receptor subunit TctC